MRRWVAARLAIAVCVGVSCPFQSGVWASPGVMLLDGGQHIWGQASVSREDEFGRQHWTGADYEDSSTYDPVSGLRALHGSALLDPWNGAESWADVLSLGVRAGGSEGTANALAEGHWIFQPRWTTLELTFACCLYGTDPASVELVDESTGRLLYHWDSVFGSPTHPRPDPETMTFGVDPTHVYRLQASLSAGAYRDGRFYSTMQGQVIPAPTSLILTLLGAGLALRKHGRRH